MQSIPLAIALALSAAGLHAIWNILLKTSGDPLRLSTRALASSAVLSTPLIAAVWLLAGRPGIPAEGWLLAASSGVLEVAYFVFLSRAYRLGELSVVYPLARGLAPLLLVLAGLLLLREHLSAVSLVGIACLLTGILVVRPPFQAGRATVPAALTGVTIAAYSTVDKVGVAQTAPWLYGWVVLVVCAGLLTALTMFNRTSRGDVTAMRPDIEPGERGPATERPAYAWLTRSWRGDVTAPDETGWPTAIMVGVLMTFTYTLILFALRLAPLAIVAPVRESAIVLVTGWGIWRLRERDLAWTRIGGAAAIIGGIALTALTG
jgi:drug/metabolite transporter (DMT)-like permease